MIREQRTASIERMPWRLAIALWSSLLALACTPIRPLDPMDSGPADGGRIEDTGASDAGAPDTGAADAGAPDACAEPELCNGVDDDCDPATPDGAGEPGLGAPCDGVDDDLCEEGVLVCSGGALACTDETDSTPELCDSTGADEDCDGEVNEGDAIDARDYYPDADLDGYGDDARVVRACAVPPDARRWVARGGDCDDTNRNVRPGVGETCNARDDDCDGEIDEEACAGCRARVYGGHTYQICTRRAGFDAAASDCAAYGYHLAVVETMAENGFLSLEARATGMGLAAASGWWIGLRLETTGWRWVDGTALAEAPWEAATGEPNGSGPCARLKPATDVWGDFACMTDLFFFCETP